MYRTSHSTRSRIAAIWVAALVVFLGAACTGASASSGGTPGIPPRTTADPAVNALFQEMIAWNPEVVRVEDSRELRSGSFKDGGSAYQCSVEDGNPLSRRFDQFPAVAFQGSVLPGLFIDGDRLLQGDIQPLPFDRAPLKLAISLASGSPVVEIANPNSATIQQAVAALQRDADSRLSGIDVVPADIEYVRKEAYSFEQTALELGFSLRFDSPLASAGLDTAFEAERSFERHTILVRMVQPMYTISFVDDHVVEPAQLLAAGVSPEQINAAIAAGRLIEGRPAVYIKSVTYGRTMHFTMTSTRVESAEALQVAMNAAYNSIGGDAEVSDEHREIIASSEIRMVAVGGDTGAAEAAIRSADPGAFFTGADTANAAPLSFRVATLSGTIASVEDVVSFNKQLCSRSVIEEPAKQYSYRFVLSGVQGFGTVKLNGTAKLEVASTVKWEPLPTSYAGSGSVTLSPANLPAGAQKVTVHFGFPANLCVDAKITLKVYVNGTFKEERGFHGCAWDGLWEYRINENNGELVRVR